MSEDARRQAPGTALRLFAAVSERLSRREAHVTLRILGETPRQTEQRSHPR